MSFSVPDARPCGQGCRTHQSNGRQCQRARRVSTRRGDGTGKVVGLPVVEATGCPHTRRRTYSHHCFRRSSIRNSAIAPGPSRRSVSTPSDAIGVTAVTASQQRPVGAAGADRGTRTTRARRRAAVSCSAARRSNVLPPRTGPRGSSGSLVGGAWRGARGASALPTSPAAGLLPIWRRPSRPSPNREWRLGGSGLSLE